MRNRLDLLGEQGDIYTGATPDRKISRRNVASAAIVSTLLALGIGGSAEATKFSCPESPGCNEFNIFDPGNPARGALVNPALINEDNLPTTQNYRDCEKAVLGRYNDPNGVSIAYNATALGKRGSRTVKVNAGFADMQLTDALLSKDHDPKQGYRYLLSCSALIKATVKARIVSAKTGRTLGAYKPELALQRSEAGYKPGYLDRLLGRFNADGLASKDLNRRGFNIRLKRPLGEKAQLVTTVTARPAPLSVAAASANGETSTGARSTSSFSTKRHSTRRPVKMKK